MLLSVVIESLTRLLSRGIKFYNKSSDVMRGEGSMRSLRRGKIRSKPFEESFTQTSSSTIIHSLLPLVIYTSHHRLKVLEISARWYVVVPTYSLCSPHHHRCARRINNRGIVIWMKYNFTSIIRFDVIAAVRYEELWSMLL